MSRVRHFHLRREFNLGERGGIDDKRHPEAPAEGLPRPTLIIDATAVMAGIEIKDA